MNMIEVESSNLNSFGLPGHVSPSEQLITLTLVQLQDLIQEATERATAPLMARLEATEARLDALEKVRGRGAEGGEDLQDLRDRLEDLEVATARERAFDRQRISRLERPEKESGKTELARAAKIEKYLAARPDRRATFETLKGHLGIGNDLLNKTIKALMVASPGRYGITRAPVDKRKRTLVMLPK